MRRPGYITPRLHGAQHLHIMRIDWELLLSYLAGTCADAERVAFEQWLAESPEHRAVLESVRRVSARAEREVPHARAEALPHSLGSQEGPFKYWEASCHKIKELYSSDTPDPPLRVYLSE